MRFPVFRKKGAGWALALLGLAFTTVFSPAPAMASSHSTFVCASRHVAASPRKTTFARTSARSWFAVFSHSAMLFTAGRTRANLNTAVQRPLCS